MGVPLTSEKPTPSVRSKGPSQLQLHWSLVLAVAGVTPLAFAKWPLHSRNDLDALGAFAPCPLLHLAHHGRFGVARVVEVLDVGLGCPLGDAHQKTARRLRVKKKVVARALELGARLTHHRAHESDILRLEWCMAVCVVTWWR